MNPFDKALPGIPPPTLRAPSSSQIIGPLNTTARDHRGKLIRHFVRELVPVPIANDQTQEEAGHEAWACAIESALDELGNCIKRGEWLAGVLKRRRKMTSTNATAPSESDTTTRSSAIATLRTLASTFHPPDPSKGKEPKHVVLCLAPDSDDAKLKTVLPNEDLGFDIISDVVRRPVCSFRVGVFVLPRDDNDEEEAQGAVLYGLPEWEEWSFPSLPLPLLAGGTFTIQNAISLPQRMAVAYVLRISIYIHLSLVLEQELLSDLSISLEYPIIPPPSIPQVAVSSSPSAKTHKSTASNVSNNLKQGFFSFLSSKKHLQNRFTRLGFPGPTSSEPIEDTTPRKGGSLDLARAPLVLSGQIRKENSSSTDDAITPTQSRLRRFSFMGSGLEHPSLFSGAPSEATNNLSKHVSLIRLLETLEKEKDFLSSSPSITIPPPPLVMDLASKEKQLEGRKHHRRLKADERAGLNSLLGWDAKLEPAKGRGMTGVRAFLRHQSIELVLRRFVPDHKNLKRDSKNPSVDELSDSSCAAYQQCGHPSTLSLRYFGGPDNLDGPAEEDVEDFEDRPLGSVITGLMDDASKPCLQHRCPAKQGEHELRLVHGETEVTIRVTGWDKPGQDVGDDAPLHIWSSCIVCGIECGKSIVSDGTWLYSFAKFIELTIYSTVVGQFKQTLCEHTTPSDDQSSWRHKIARHFSRQECIVSITTAPVLNIFDLRVPRLQVDSTYAGAKAESATEKANLVLGINIGDAKKNLRKEIKCWWEGMADHLDKLVRSQDEVSEDIKQFRKALPRLPSVDDAYEEDELDDTPRPSVTPTAPMVPSTPPEEISGLPPSRPGSPRLNAYLDKIRAVSPLSFASSEYFPRMKPKPPPKDIPLNDPTAIAAPAPILPHRPMSSPAVIIPPPTPVLTSTSSSTTPRPSALQGVEIDSNRLLNALRENFQRVEQNLYTQLAKCPDGKLNDVRRSFLTAARGAEKRLKIWQKKHLSSVISLPSKLECQEPPWFGNGSHALPGGNVIVREDDWGSIIAYTMSTQDYLSELAGMTSARIPSSSFIQPASSSVSSPESEAPTSATGSSFFGTSSSYKLFSLGSESQPDPDQDDIVWHEPEPYSAVVSRKDHPRDPTSLLSIREVLRQKSPSEVSALSSLGSRFGMRSSSSLAPPPPSAWSKPDVQVSMQAADGEVAGLPGNSSGTSEAGRKLQEIDAVAEPISRPGSSLSGSYATSLSSIAFEGEIKRKSSSIFSFNSDKTAGPDSRPTDATPRPDVPTVGEQAVTALAEPQPHRTGSVFSNTLTAGLTNAMRFVLNGGDIGEHAASPQPKNQHGLLSTEAITIDERPHIKYDWTVGKRLKFSCTIYYAKQFDSLRKRCGIDDVFLQSLASSSNWAADGGKSRSNFWKTADDRFIIKTLVNAWNVADLQVLIELGPSYFKYLESTTAKPSVLAKLMGFYTIEVRNLETGSVQSKSDLLIMENLFYEQHITKTFDMKGIRGRRVKPSSTSKAPQSRTLFDGDWIDSQKVELMFIRPHSKHVLREALKGDADFLARSNIMDYSLLLGIDEEQKRMSCGLVDTIGVYTFAKTLEYKAKQGLNSGKDVTVIPPTEYQTRFVNSLEGYFVPCPDKWTKPLNNNKVVTDLRRLPSIL
ncbi:hypothetical protein DL96DRAFT_1457068 [Flagelloscypha sp. PMI_526]|nr:hypothetical protein DL96DRAFT_1457068 [Flagelloscypha sp. PMI_526]